MTPWCDDLVCSWRRLLADRHSLPFPRTLSLHRRWCPSASHHPVTFLFLPALTVPLPCPFLSFRKGGGGGVPPLPPAGQRGTPPSALCQAKMNGPRPRIGGPAAEEGGALKLCLRYIFGFSTKI